MLSRGKILGLLDLTGSLLHLSGDCSGDGELSPGDFPSTDRVRMASLGGAVTVSDLEAEVARGRKESLIGDTGLHTAGRALSTKDKFGLEAPSGRRRQVGLCIFLLSTLSESSEDGGDR